MKIYIQTETSKTEVSSYGQLFNHSVSQGSDRQRSVMLPIGKSKSVPVMNNKEYKYWRSVMEKFNADIAIKFIEGPNVFVFV